MADTVIETERLLLRHWREGDREPFARLNADPQVMEYFVSVLSRCESDALADRISARLEEQGYGLFALERKEDGAFLGFTGFSQCPEGTPVAGETEIGWRLAREYWRRGYAFEAAAACLDWFWANTTAPRLVSFTSDRNGPSQNLMRKLGLARRPELDFDYPSIPAGHALRSQVVYALERSEARHG